MSSPHAHSAPDACSVGFDRAGVTAWGTAAQARFFIALEQPGPWGRDAAQDSHLPADVGRSLSEECASRGGRLTLIRRPGPHPDAHLPSSRTAYLAWSGADPWLVHTQVADPALLLAADLEALSRGDRATLVASLPGAHTAEPILLVCTNGRRDVCCAVRGRPVALEAERLRPGRVWEASHTGGHRFAPTGVLLPHGATFARLDPSLCVEVLEAAQSGALPASVLGPRHDRGRSLLEPGAQAAESCVRSLVAETSLGSLTTTPLGTVPDACDPARAWYAVAHRDGRTWTVGCLRLPADPSWGSALPESCGKPAIPVLVWDAALAPGA